ncbi:MAG: 3-hydroxyacyl-CoA dehydrogenase NAD-binding domain-containing protein [Planctomycetota bacterium]|nr:3-hydroxyacyl-CoA dehydrogenase NAD-binding domain-containing protein [Planctomycetota bacterium]
MNYSTINKVCIAGAGYMGSQIGLQCAVHGKEVTMWDIDNGIFDKSRSQQAQLLEDQVEANKITADQIQLIQSRIVHSADLQEATSRSELVIEAIREELEAKRALFNAIDQACSPTTIISSNSSSIRISRIQDVTQHPARVLNTHFVQPVWKHPFVELMKGTETSDVTIQCVAQFMREIGILPVFVRKENTGFIFNCIWRSVKRESLRLVDQGIARCEDIDRTWMIQMETSMGPFALMDRVGLDVVRDIEMVYYHESGDERDKPPQLLEDKIKKGELGVKTGIGFYQYPDPIWQDKDFLKDSPPL